MSDLLLAAIKDRDERVKAALWIVWDHIRTALAVPDSHGDDLPHPNPYTGEGHQTQAQEGSR